MKISDIDLEALNNLLKEHFGVSTDTNQPMWRFAWSEDQFEKRHGTFNDFTPGGIFIRQVTEVREVPKYRQWIHEKYVLEHLVAVPDVSMAELPTVRMSYEPIWVFEDKNGNYLPPKFEAAKFIIDTVHAAQFGTGNLKKYEDVESNQEKALEHKKKTVDGIIEELFGEQSSLEGTTVTGESVIVPRNFEKTVH